ncbi:MAG: hypothetical protein H0W36_07480 [Gemmatimonadetes bacterium]|nr:hypothetical protein [Gemmatimonadota bacterium]
MTPNLSPQEFTEAHRKLRRLGGEANRSRRRGFILPVEPEGEVCDWRRAQM